MDKASSDSPQSVDITYEMVRDHVWSYFVLHAEQRLKAFHFFIILETALIGAMLIASRLGTTNPKLFSLVGVLILLFAFVFWKLDQRTKGMIKTSEGALQIFERHALQAFPQTGLDQAMPFINDPQNKGQVGLSPFGVLSYSKCFGAIFLVFGILGAAVAIQFAAA